MAGLLLPSPFVLYQLWCFISPGLYRNEKRYVMPFMVSTVALFLAGGYFGYKLVLTASSRIPDRLWKRLPAHDYAQRIQFVVSDHHCRSWRYFRDADPGIFSGSHGDRQRRLDVAQSSLLYPRNLYHRRHYYADDRYPEHVHLRRSYDCLVHSEHRNCVAGASHSA